MALRAWTRCFILILVFPQGCISDAAEKKVWTVCEACGDEPVARFGHASAAIGSCVYIFGGASGPETLDDFFVLQLGGSRA